MTLTKEDFAPEELERIAKLREEQKGLNFLEPDKRDIYQKIKDEEREISEQVALRKFEAYNGDVVEMIKMIKNQVPLKILEQHENAKMLSVELKDHYSTIEEKIVENEQQSIYEKFFSDAYIKLVIEVEFSLYMSFIKKNAQQKYKGLLKFIDNRIAEKEKIIQSQCEFYIQSEPVPESISTVRSDKYSALMDNITNNIFGVHKDNSRFYDGEKVLLPMEGRDSNTTVDTIVGISFNGIDDDEDTNITARGAKKIDMYDIGVLDAILTIACKEGNEWTCTKAIHGKMSGDYEATMTEKQRQDILESVRKQRDTILYINNKEESETFGTPLIIGELPMLPVEIFTAPKTINNNTVADAIHILSKPRLYEYADNKNQIESNNMKLFKLPINMNKETYKIRNYLLRRIAAMKNNNKNKGRRKNQLSRDIIYDNVFRTVDLSEVPASQIRKKKMAIRTKVKEILEYWRKEGYIKGYKENKRGHEMYSITIIL